MQSHPDSDAADDPYNDTGSLESSGSYSDSHSAYEEDRQSDDWHEEEDDFYEPASSRSSSTKKSKKRKIYCFNCNRQEFHLMAYKGSWLHSFLVGVTFGLARFVGPYRCTCCGKKRAMYADFCSLSFHLRKAKERRLSDSNSGRSSRSRSSSRRKR